MMPHTPALGRDSCSFLVLGAGLSGLAAALAAQAAAPKARVVLVSASSVAAGSSFANRNGRLGLQVCRTAGEVEAFVAETMALASPGWADPALARITAEESAAALDWLLGLGATLDRQDDGAPTLYPACFSPHSRRAFMVTDLPGLHRRLLAHFQSRGGQLLAPWLVAELVGNHGGPVAGARLVHAQDPARQRLLLAQATILAVGGPANLYPASQAGSAVPGHGLGLLARAGAALVNTSWLQLFWAEADSLRFWPAQNIALSGFRLRRTGAPAGHGQPRGPELELMPAPELLALVGERGSHCPLAWGRPDAAIDRWLLAQAEFDGCVRVFEPGRGWFEVLLAAHAGNGGAQVDAWGRTSRAGLYAVGECASAMHGANRLGGAMVAACLVFGQRAGRHAARQPPRHAADFAHVASCPLPPLATQPQQRREILADLGQALRRSLLANTAELQEIIEHLCQVRALAQDWQASLALDSGLAILRHALGASTAE